MAQVDLKDAVVKIKDGGSEELTIKIGEGNLSWTETHNRTYVKDRGNLDTVKNGDEEPLDVKLTATWEYYKSTGSGDISPDDAMLQRGGAAAWQSSDADLCAPYAVDIECVITPPCTGQTMTYTLPDFRVESVEFDLKAGTINLNGKCNIVAPTRSIS